jgi:putative ubiquitin-RnfH superfamily antitoxin RatB of RatAB toxin-antitoxin module
VINVEIVYAAPQRTVCKTLAVPDGATLAEALQQAALDPSFAGLDLMSAPVSIFGALARADQVLGEGDRIELLRPLAADPKAARRERVKQARRASR